MCAVPFLKESVVRKSKSNQTMNEKEKLLSDGIKEHYISLYKEAKEIVGSKSVPIISTGHFTTVGSKSSDSERDIYIGGTLDIDSDFLGDNFDYVALGHLHNNQKVKRDNVRYSGSPIPLSFSEITTQKRVNIVEFKDSIMSIEELDIPLFRTLLLFRGDLDTILKSIESIVDKDSWIEVHLKDENQFYANQKVREKAEELGVVILAVKIDRSDTSLSVEDFNVISLDELEPLDVFKRRIKSDELEDDKLEKELILKFKEVLLEVQR